VAQQAHVTINPVDTMGLRLGWHHRQGRAVLESSPRILVGIPIVATNDFEPGLRQIFVENSSYYLMAYAPTHDSRRWHLSQDLAQRQRPSRLRPSGPAGITGPTRGRSGTSGQAAASAAVEAMAGILPTVQAAAACHGGCLQEARWRGRRRRDLARGQAARGRCPHAGAGRATVKAFTADGDERGSDAQTIAITHPGRPAGQRHRRMKSCRAWNC
jgi:hypothetical protein